VTGVAGIRVSEADYLIVPAVDHITSAWMVSVTLIVDTILDMTEGGSRLAEYAVRHGITSYYATAVMP